MPSPLLGEILSWAPFLATSFSKGAFAVPEERQLHSFMSAPGRASDGARGRKAVAQPERSFPKRGKQGSRLPCKLRPRFGKASQRLSQPQETEQVAPLHISTPVTLGLLFQGTQ